MSEVWLLLFHSSIGSGNGHSAGCQARSRVAVSLWLAYCFRIVHYIWHSDFDFALGEGIAEVPDQEPRDGEEADRVDTTTVAVNHAPSRREEELDKCVLLLRDLGDYSKSTKILGPTQLLWAPLLCLNRGSDRQHFPA